ncbi:hypothetical protein OG21DRAFT_519620 [Imleria badia]|nr:hypothetical protein OG21DRAFT_519620 [Imleria badia]
MWVVHVGLMGGGLGLVSLNRGRKVVLQFLEFPRSDQFNKFSPAPTSTSTTVRTKPWHDDYTRMFVSSKSNSPVSDGRSSI